MAITDIQISEELQAGAPSIKYRGNEGPKAPMETAMADPMLIEEYERYVYEMKEQGREPVSFEQFVQEIMSGMADGGRAGYGLGSLVKSITRPVKKLAKSDFLKSWNLYHKNKKIPLGNNITKLDFSKGENFKEIINKLINSDF